MSINIYNAAEDKLTHLAGMNCFADSPIGTIIGSLSTVTPTGYLYCDNTAYSAESYPELWAVLPNSVKDTTNNTFTIDLRETSLKGEGLTSLSNNHYSSAGLSLGEFIDDRVQEHTHTVDYNSPQSGIPGNGVVYDDTTQKTNLGTNSGRSGATTEVKSRAVRWYIKAKMVAMPSDFMSKVDEAVEEVVGNLPYTFGTSVSLDSVTSSTPYTFPTDGYLNVRADSTGNWARCIARVNNKLDLSAEQTVTAIASSNLLFVRKGMTAYVLIRTDTTYCHVEFTPLV